MHIYARTTVITNVVGRADYVSNPNRQEHLLAVAGIQDKDYWRQLAKDSQAAWRRAGGDREKSAREAREIHVQLPRDILDMPPEEQQRVADQLSAFFRERYAVENITGLHLSKTDNNVHAHVLFAERQRLPEPEIRIADRNAFLDENGVRRRTKKEILDADGQLRPGCRIVPKGEVLYSRHFGDADPIYAEKAWIQDVKQDLANWINETLQPDLKREVFDPAGPYLAQVKIGKGRPAENEVRIREYNAAVRTFNAAVRDGRISEEQAQEIKLQVMLSPDRLQGLRAATHMAFANTVPMNEKRQGGVRTHTGPNEDKKRQLRELYRKAADFRRQAKEATSTLDRNMLQAEARKCSAQIDRLRRELGYFKDEDYARRNKQINEELKRIREMVLRRKRRVRYLDHHADSLQRRVDWIWKQLMELPAFMRTKEEQEEWERLTQELTKAKADRSIAWAEEADARRQYKAQRKAARIQRKELVEEKKQLRREQRALQTPDRGR